MSEGMMVRIGVNELHIDSSYQRPIKTNSACELIKKQGWLENACGALIVAKRMNSNGTFTYYIMDGQSRWTAAKALGIKELKCVITITSSAQEEAIIFKTCNKNKKNTTAWDEFRSDLVAQDPLAVQLNMAVKNLGLQVSNNDGKTHVTYVKHLIECYKIDRKNAINALSICRDLVMSSDKKMQMLVFVGVFDCLQQNPSIYSLIRKDIRDGVLLRKGGQSMIIAEAKKLMSIVSNHHTTSYAMQAFKNVFNKCKKTNTI